MITVRLVNLNDNEFTERVCDVRVRRGDRIPGHNCPSGTGRSVVHVEVAIALVIWMKGKTQQSLFTAGGTELAANVQEGNGGSGCGIVRKNHYTAALLNDENPVRTVIAVGQEKRLCKGEVRKGVDKLYTLGGRLS